MVGSLSCWRMAALLRAKASGRPEAAGRGDLTFMPGRPGGYAGKTPVVRHTGKRFHLNMLSAISAKGELRFMTSRKRLSAALFIEFLRRLITNYPQ